ncbi:MAG: ABC transporter ATP-binding protein [Candidatus Dormibacteria bacterium]
MTPNISVTGLSRRYRDQLALDDITFDIEGPSITGILGQNGAGKTTLLRIIAALEFPTAGRVRVLGSSPLENDTVLSRMMLVREDQVFPNCRIQQILEVASWFYPNWSGDLADSLLEEFDLPPSRRIEQLSRGMRTAVSLILGLAARTEVTLFDEPYAGLDAVARQRVSDRLLTEFSQLPRTMVVSTHQIDEAADLLERVVLIDRGRVVLDAAPDEIRGSSTSVSGPTHAVEQFVAGRLTWERRSAGSQTSAIVDGILDDGDRSQARELHLSLEALSLQQLMVHAAAQAAVGQTGRTST